MKWFDRFLLFTASISVLAIIYLFSASQINSNYISTSDIPQDPDVVVYNEEVDRALEKYFETIKENPELEEEEKRLFNLDHENDNDSENNLKNNQDNSNAELKNNNQTDIQEKNSNNIHNNPQPKNFFQLTEHRVKRGESIWRIAQKYSVSVATISSANPGKASRIIQPGDLLKIPNKNGILYKIKKGDSLGKIAIRYKIKISDIKDFNRIQSNIIHSGDKIFLPDAKPLPKKKIAWRKLFIMPLSGRITSGFGWRKSPFTGKKQFHTGIDIGGNPIGTRVKATASGVVIHSGWAGQFGKMIIIKHKNGYFSVYGHLSKILVKKNKYIKRGEIIGKVGSTGLSTGPHLHFEIKKYQKPINPFTALKKKEKVYIKG